MVLSFVQDVISGKANMAIGSLPLTLLLAAIPHWHTIYIAESKKVQGGWANENPRAWVARLNSKAASGKKLTETEEYILRGQSAQQNGFEWFPVWAAAVILGTLAKLPKEQMDRYTVIHIAARIIYYYLYLAMGKRGGSYLRTAIFQVSIFPAVAIFFQSARALAL
ncbi:uncharacterized protein FA14DRAFT_160590 [Meira miltonrushii]|uniref:Putative membrane protein n=1 Tax=Meira miltonrushii TaxID=1280837 RepID=A0A316VD28_9BASI|nr:uncharacterized protein FA14DRAFT_160590 [Meira miltonrushii]PWN35446.1 putative membrane protein [Meira miltonrushii]